MRKKAAREYFQTNARIARILGISKQAVGKWGAVVPYYSAVRLMAASHGVLTVNEKDYDRLGKARAIAA